jgi:quercetin dioxygenase-like cupin family protein
MKSQTGSIVRHPVLTAHLDGKKLVDHVEVKRITLAPGQPTGYHFHPCPVISIVERGEILFQIEGEPPQTKRAGDAIFEPANTKILHFDATREPATFVAFYLLGEGEEELIRMLQTE